MQHFANFGIVKQANKRLKKLEEMRPLINPDKGAIEMNVMSNRAKRKYKEDPLSYPVKENYSVSQHKIPSLPTDDWANIRRPAKDTRVIQREDGNYLGKPKIEVGYSNHGTYLGRSKDPNKGLGGLVEEVIPNEDFFKNPPVELKTYHSRLSGLNRKNRRPTIDTLLPYEN
jgi:hypothetical protein